MFDDIKEDKSLKYLILGAVVLSLIILVKEVILKPEQLSLPESPYSSSKIKINFNLLEDKALKELILFERISPPGEVGRENPFKPY